MTTWQAEATEVRCANPVCPSQRSGRPRWLGRVSGEAEFVCPRCGWHTLVVDGQLRAIPPAPSHERR